MSVTLQLSGTYASAIGSPTTVGAEPGTVAEIIADVSRRFRGFNDVVLAPDGALKRHVEFRVYISQDSHWGERMYGDVRTLSIPDNSTLWFIDQQAGG